jgi:hypothetical protein
MRVGVYVDGYNLYYGGRALCGRGASGWRWLDIRELVRPFVGWSGSNIEKVVYCTARVSSSDSASAATDQAIYLEALIRSRSIDVLEEGRYVSWAKEAPLVDPRSGEKAPRLLKVTGNERWDRSLPLRRSGDVVLATVQKREEKGSDVNVATHLLYDVLTRDVDAAIVVSNDSDLALPISRARMIVPVGTINPQKHQLAGALRGSATEGAGRHWWKQLRAEDVAKHSSVVAHY